MASKYVIEKDVPIPGGFCYRYPFKQMEIGDSFLIGNDETMASRVRSAGCNYSKKHNKKFTVRKCLDGYRIWRVE